MRKVKRQSSKLNIKGFTLIELLIVIAIIGLLSSVVMASLVNARKKARDAKRVSDLIQIKTALELYYNDYGYYPAAGGCAWDSNCYVYSYSSPSWDGLAAALVPNYLARLPVDPLNKSCAPWGTSDCYSYAYGNVGRTTYPAQYDLTAQLEDLNNPLRCSVKNYTFYFDNQAWCGAYSPMIYEASQ